MTKKLAVVVDIAGLDFLTSTVIGRTIQYGDPIFYGDGSVYDGLIPIGAAPGERGQKTLLNLDRSSLTISQRLEPEQGRAAISTLNMSFIDKDQYMTMAVTPGKLIPEILGAEVKIWLGYAQTSFPTDYYVVWRGRVAQVNPEIGIISLQFTDPNIVKRQNIFYTAQTLIGETLVNIVTGVSNVAFTVAPGDVAKFTVGQSLQITGSNTSPEVAVQSILGVTITVDSSLGFTPAPGDTVHTGISESNVNVPVVSNTDFHKKILGPNGLTYDQTVKTYIKVDDEFIEYQQIGQEGTGFGTNSFLNVLRGARFTFPAFHDIGASVDSYVELSGHSVEIALKLQLSGWGGPYLDDYAFTALVQTGDPDVPIVTNAIVLNNYVDAIRDLGLTIGDFITITGDPNFSNNGLTRVVGFDNSLGQTNKLILTDKTFIASPMTPALLALRSQFDVYPDSCGCKLPGWEVDVAGHLFYEFNYLSGSVNNYRFLINASEAGKSFIESQIMLPLGAYCLTRQGKLSMGLTKPPIADERTSKLDHSNVIDPQNIKLQRGLNNRKYFNEIDWQYDYDDNGDPISVRKTLDTDSLNLIGISSVLPIDAKGARTDLGFETIVERRERFLLGRYANAAVTIDIKTNFGTGNLIEAGDVIILADDGQLQIPNMVTGVRNLGTQLFEVINRSIDIKTGQVSLQLLGGVESLVGDRYATISPSSFVTTGTTSSKIRITESFGEIYPTQEQNKWIQYPGMKIQVRSPDFTTRYGETNFLGIDPGDNHAMLVDPPLSFTPQVNDIVELAPYPTNTDALDQRIVKLIHCYLDPSVPVTSGVDNFSFNVSPGDAAKFLPLGRTILVHNDAYTLLSPEVIVTSVVGNLVTVDSSLGFTPSSSETVELIGFADWDEATGSGAPYRFI